jgi:hypothetical protein
VGWVGLELCGGGLELRCWEVVCVVGPRRQRGNEFGAFGLLGPEIVDVLHLLVQ